MNVSKLAFMAYDKTMESNVRRLFIEYPHKDYQLRVMGVSKDRMAEYLHTTLDEPGMQTICLRDNGSLAGMIALEFLPWMSEHFGLRMYAVRHLLARLTSPLVHSRLLRFVIEELKQVDFLDCRVAVDDILSAHALEVCGFRYVGTELFMGKKLIENGAPKGSAHAEICACEPCDRAEVLDIVEESHVHNRFVYDPLIDGQAARSLYRRLVDNCFEQSGFNVFVAKSDNRVQGFIVAKTNCNFSRTVGVGSGSLDFIGVRPETRKLGLGSALNRVVLRQMTQDGLAYAGVRTLANNYPALRNCLTTGFGVTSSSLHFHMWIRRAKSSHRRKTP
jgi:ribosomal protein S18 acetylase RimI-like enzyme